MPNSERAQSLMKLLPAIAITWLIAGVVLVVLSKPVPALGCLLFAATSTCGAMVLRRSRS